MEIVPDKISKPQRYDNDRLQPKKKILDLSDMD